MALILGQLKKAQLENTSTDPTKRGEINFNTSSSKAKIHDGSSAKSLVTEDGTAALTNKTIDGDDNTVQDLPITALKTVLADASKFLERDASGVPQSGKAVPSGAVVGTTDSQTLTNKTVDDALTAKEVATPSNPSAGYRKVYFKADGKLYQLNSSGTEEQIGAGGSGGSIKWSEQALAPLLIRQNGADVYKFEDGENQYLYTFIKVPSSYTGGRQITLKSLWHTSVTSGDVLFQTQATLIRVGTDAADSTTNQRTSTNTATTVNGTANVVTAVSCDLTDSNGQINSVAVSAGDLILVRLTRDTSTDTAASAANIYADASEVNFG